MLKKKELKYQFISSESTDINFSLNKLRAGFKYRTNKNIKVKRIKRNL